MSTRKEIIKQLKEDLLKINVVNGYSTDVADVRIGIISPDKFTIKPAIGLWSYEDQVIEQLMEDDVQRLLRFTVYGYIDVTEDYDDYEPIFDFVKDVEKFLYSTNNTYSDNTLITMTKTNFGGISSPVGYFIIFFDIEYYQTDF